MGPKASFHPGDRIRDLAAHHLALQVSVGVVFAGIIVSVLGDRIVQRQLLQPGIVIWRRPSRNAEATITSVKPTR